LAETSLAILGRWPQGVGPLLSENSENPSNPADHDMPAPRGNTP
jgi:hypothetical protein